MFSHCCENEPLAPQQEAALEGESLMNHRAKSPFLEGIILSALSNNTPRPQPDGCGVMGLEWRLPGYKVEIYLAFPANTPHPLLKAEPSSWVLQLGRAVCDLE